jgi:hypothetical protein
MVGGRMGTSKWAGNNGIDVFVPKDTPFRMPADGDVTFGTAPTGPSISGTAVIHFTSGELAGTYMHLLHVQTEGASGTYHTGDEIAKAHDDGLDIGGSSCNWQHFDVAMSTTGTFEDGSQTPSGNINANSKLKELGFNISEAPGRTNGPQQLLAGGCPFDDAGGEGGTGEGSKQDAKRQWYMPAAVPAGGGVKGKVQPIGEKCLDSKAAEKGGRGIIDAAAADHVHSIKAAGDDDIQPVGGTGSTSSGGDRSSGFALGNHQHAPGSGGGMLMMSHRDELLDKINALEARVLQLEAICH